MSKQEIEAPKGISLKSFNRVSACSQIYDMPVLDEYGEPMIVGGVKDENDKVVGGVPVILQIIGEAAKEVQDFEFAQHDKEERRKWLAGKKGDKDADKPVALAVHAENSVEKACLLVKGWKGIDAEFNHENLFYLMENNPDLRADVFKNARDTRNFLLKL